MLDQAKSRGAKGDGFDKLEQRLNEIGEEPIVVSEITAEVPPQQPNILDSLKLDQAIKLATKKTKDGSPEEAKHIYQDILVKFPKNKRASDGLKRLVRRPAGKFSKVQDAPKDELQALMALYKKGQLSLVVEQAQVLTKQYPTAFTVWNLMGVAAAQNGQLDQAIFAFQRTLAIKPDHPESYINIGNTLQYQGRLEEAIEAYNKALTIKPDNAEAYNNMGVIFKEQGKLEDAIEAYNKALVIQPDNAEAYYNIGVAFRNQGKLEEAIDAFKENGSAKSQTFILKCLYELDRQANFYDQLDYLVDRGENNAVIGSYISRSQIKYGIIRTNPFCNEPLKYILHTNLTKHCDFENIFIKGATDILTKDIVQNRSQSLLTNGIQTKGNVFNQIGEFADEIQSILRSEIENYRMSFKDNQEGFIKSWPSDYEVNGWLISMKSGGKLEAHMHDNGWISGSVYINVPPKVNKDSGNFVVCLDNEKDSVSIDVVTGSLCLFPSSLLHYTIPFEADENRIVLAFDVIPK